MTKRIELYHRRAPSAIVKIKAARMKHAAAYQKLRAKTGTLRGASSLAGYTASADNEKIAFSIMVEHFVTRTSRIRKVQDEIGEIISRFSRLPADQISSETESERK